MRRFHESRIVLQLSGRKQAVILIVTSPKEEHHGLVSRAVDRGRATRRQRGTVLSSQPPHPRKDARALVVAHRAHASASGQGCRSQSGHRPAVRGRVSAGGLGRPAAVESQSSGERDGRLSRLDPRILREATGHYDRRGVRTHLSTDRVAPRSQPGAQVPQGSGPEVQPGPCDPRAAKKNLAEDVADQAAFLETKLKAVLAYAQAGEGHVFFVDAAHFVFGTFLCCLWSFTRIFVRAASGRQRFNVLGAWNAVTRELITVTNTTVVNTETLCELLRKIADLGLTGPITLVLDNARYQRNAVVQALAAQLGITLLFLPSYSPNLNLIERLWKFTKRRALYGRYHPTFRDFQAAIQEVLDGVSTKYSQQLASLMTLNFQQFDDVSLMAAQGIAYLAGVAKHAADHTQGAAPGRGLRQRIGEEQGTHQICVGRVIQEDDKTARVTQTSGV